MPDLRIDPPNAADVTEQQWEREQTERDRVEALDAPRVRTGSEPHSYGDRSKFRRYNDADPWSPLVARPDLRKQHPNMDPDNPRSDIARYINLRGTA